MQILGALLAFVGSVVIIAMLNMNNLSVHGFFGKMFLLLLMKFFIFTFRVIGFVVQSVSAGLWFQNRIKKLINPHIFFY